MNLLKKLFGPRKPEVTRTHLRGADLSPWEWEEMKAGRCPDCSTFEAFLAGPEGAGSQMLLCSICGSEFTHGGFFCHRASVPFEGRWAVYGLPAKPQRVIIVPVETAVGCTGAYSEPAAVLAVVTHTDFKTAVLELLDAIDTAAMDRSALVGHSPYIELMVSKARVVRARIPKV